MGRGPPEIGVGAEVTSTEDKWSRLGVVELLSHV